MLLFVKCFYGKYLIRQIGCIEVAGMKQNAAMVLMQRSQAELIQWLIIRLQVQDAAGL